MTWSQAVWPLLLAGIVLTLPGLLVGVALGLRGVGALTTAPLISLGVLAGAVMLASATHRPWGALSLLGATALLTAAAVVVGSAQARLARRRAGRDGGAHVGWTGRSAAALPRLRAGLRDPGVWWVGGGAAVAGACLLVLLPGALGRPDAVHQSWDAPFHLNGIDSVLRTGSASPGTVSRTANIFGPALFYPPLFHALAALIVPACHGSVPAAANLSAIAAAVVVWPLSMLGLVWALAPRRSALVAAVAVTSVMPAFPPLLMSFGVLWPNLLGLSALPAALALAAGILRPVRAPGPVTASLAAGGLGALGLYYAHPGTIFAGVAVCLPLLAGAVVRLAARLAGWAARRTMGRGTAPAAAAAVAVFLLVLAVVWLMGARLWAVVDGLAAIATTRAQDWKAVESYPQAVGEALAYTANLIHPVFVLGVLTVVGAVVALTGRCAWLVPAHGIVVYLYALAAGTDDPISTVLTGFWYNDRFRLLALLPVTGVPLAALGATAIADHLADRLVAARRDGRFGPLDPMWTSRAGQAVWRWRVPTALLLTLALAAWAAPLRTARDSVQVLVATGYQGEKDHQLTTPAEVALYESLAGQPDPSAAVTGSPFTGAVVAGVLSHRPWIFGHMKNLMNADQQIVAERFKELASDPAVCGAIRRLRIGYVTEDTQLAPATPDQLAQYAGLTGLAGTPGLTQVAHEGTVTAYRVTGCR